MFLLWQKTTTSAPHKPATTFYTTYSYHKQVAIRNLWIAESADVGLEVVDDSPESCSSYQQDYQHDVGEGGGEVYFLWSHYVLT